MLSAYLVRMTFKRPSRLEATEQRARFEGRDILAAWCPNRDGCKEAVRTRIGR